MSNKNFFKFLIETLITFASVMMLGYMTLIILSY